MSYMNRAVIAAGVTEAVQGLQDQGMRFNSALRVLLQQNARRNYYAAASKQFNRVSADSPANACFQKKFTQERMAESEESLRKVIYLSCWGPN